MKPRGYRTVKPKKVTIYNDGRPINTLNLSDKDRRQLLDQREMNSGGFASDNRRRAERHRLAHKANIVVTVCQADGTLIRYAVIARNLSETGAAFMHGAYLHMGTGCVVTIQTNEGKWVSVVGQVVRCNFVSGKVHEIGVAFKKSIKLEQFLSVQKQEPAAADAAQSIVRLVGRILYVTGDVELGRAFRDTIKTLGLQSTMVKQVEEAAMMIGGRSRFDLVVIDESIIGPNDPAPIELFVEQGCQLPMLLVTEAELAEETLARHAAESGYQGVLQRPHRLEQVTNALLQHLPLADAA
jgi:hypothetical protein